MNGIQTKIEELHHLAMQLADEAFYAKREEKQELAQRKYLEAFEYERIAAMLLVNDYQQDPFISGAQLIYC